MCQLRGTALFNDIFGTFHSFINGEPTMEEAGHLGERVGLIWVEEFLKVSQVVKETIRWTQ